MNKKGITKVIVIPDLQTPYHDKRSLKAVEKYMANHRWDIYINLGDFMDLDCISAHSKGQLRQVEGKRLKEDYDVGNQILDKHQKLLRGNNRNAKFIYLEGNHEFRIERYLDVNPAGQGYLEVENALHLEERGIEYIRCYKEGEVYRLGKACFHHGLYTNDLHAKKHALQFGKNIFYGHLHDVQGYSMTQHGDGDAIVGQSLGCLCEYRQDYIKGNPKRWQQAVTTFFFQPNGHFSYYVSRIFDHKFVGPDGVLYDGN